MNRSCMVVCVLSLLPVIAASAQPLGTAFTYQGEVRNAEGPASGHHDLRFRLYDAAVGGAQVGPTLCSDNLVLAEGRFAVSLDFGAQFAGQQRFLEIEVREDMGLDCSNGTGFVTLTPRQLVAAAPNAGFALNAGTANTAASATTAISATTATNAGQLNGQAASFYQNATNLTSGTIPDARLGGTYSGALLLSNAGNAFTGAFMGSGSGLTGLNASNIASGTLADARLTANVAILHTNQTFTGGKAFSTAPAFTAAGAPFTVTSGTQVMNLNADLLDGLHASAFLQAIPVPLTLSGSSPTQIFMADNAASDLGSSGVRGRSSAASGLTYGVIGVSDSTAGRGVAGQATSGTGAAYGVQGASASVDGRGVYGTVTAISGSTFGGYFEGVSTAATGAFGLASAGSGSTTGLSGQSNSTSGRGVYGLATAATGTTTGVYGWSDSTSGRGMFGYAGATTGDTRGVYAVSESSSGRGVFGHAVAPSGTTYGVYGQSDSTSGRGVYGLASTSTGTTYGVYGRSDSTSGRGVFGLANTSSGVAYGGYFQSNSTSGAAVFGLANAGSGSTYGGYFQNDSTTGRAVAGVATAGAGVTYGGHFQSASTSGYGVYGLASYSGSGTTYGVFGQSNSFSGRGVYGYASATGAYGVYGYEPVSGLGYAVYANGDMGASGNKPFRIDHPQDPENKYLLHYAAESPEVINFYRGTVALDGAGEAVVELPPYFASINKDPSYTLTALGAPMPMLHVAEEISQEALKDGEAAGPGVAPPICSFRIAGGVPGAKVSWRVEAVRNDLRMRLHGAPVEREKTGTERGKYQHPEYYGLPPEKGVDHQADGAVLPE